MARYIDAEALYKILNERNILEMYKDYMAVNRAINDTPTADVVPKSDVEELEAECERQYEQAKADILANMADGGTSCHWCIDEHKAQAKAEVAREIFEEIEKTAGAAIILLKYESNEDVRNIKAECYTDFIGYIAELKKKYLEVNNEIS